MENRFSVGATIDFLGLLFKWLGSMLLFVPSLTAVKKPRLNRRQYRVRIHNVQVMDGVGATDGKEQLPALILSDKGIEPLMLGWEDIQAVLFKCDD